MVVTGSAGRPVRRPLREFIGADGPRLVAVHAKLADPRPLLLATLAQIRQHLELAVKLSERIYDLRAMQQFEEEVVHAIDAADPALAVQIGERLERRRALGLAPGAPGQEPSGRAKQVPSPAVLVGSRRGKSPSRCPV